MSEISESQDLYSVLTDGEKSMDVIAQQSMVTSNMVGYIATRLANIAKDFDNLVIEIQGFPQDPRVVEAHQGAAQAQLEAMKAKSSLTQAIGESGTIAGRRIFPGLDILEMATSDTARQVRTTAKEAESDMTKKIAAAARFTDKARSRFLGVANSADSQIELAMTSKRAIAEYKKTISGGGPAKPSA